MSKMLIVSTEGDAEQTQEVFSVKINPDLAQEITLMAVQSVKVETLITEMLEQYVANRPLTTKSGGAAFLLSLAGMFNSGANRASENVRAVVTDFILRKHGKEPA